MLAEGGCVRNFLRSTILQWLEALALRDMFRVSPIVGILADIKVRQYLF